jgi:hypothetical protein
MLGSGALVAAGGWAPQAPSKKLMIAMVVKRDRASSRRVFMRVETSVLTGCGKGVA